MINVKNVTKVFYPHSSKEITVLENASLSLPDTGMVFIVGQSGIGKSTILNAIGGLINYEGEITYDNVKVNIEKYRKENIGVIFQDFLLFDDASIKDNILVGLENAGINSQKEVDYRVGKLLSAVNLHVNALRKAGDLSLGQKQRVAIARALATSPKILLADEPTGNLDSANAYKIMDILKSLSKNHLIICVTHNQTLVKKYADYAFSINNKKIEEFDIKKIEEDPNYVDYRKIYANNLHKKEIKEGNLLFKVYNDDSNTLNEIQIIKRGNEILVVGDNISVAKPSEVTFVNKKEEKLEKEGQAEVIESNIDLDFDNIKSKKTFKDFFKYYFLKNKLKQSNTKSKRKARYVFNNITKIFFSIFIFFITNVLFGVIKVNQSMVGDLSTDSQVLLNTNKGEDRKNFIIKGNYLPQIVNNPESGIIEDSFFNPTYVYVQQSLYGDNQKLVPQLVGGYSGTSNLVARDDSKYFGPLCDSTNLYLYNERSIYFYSFEKAKEDGLCPELEKYELNDDEVLLNKSLVATLSTKNPSEFLNKEIAVNFYSDTSYNLAPLTFKIKAIVDTPYNVCFAKNDIANLITFNDIFHKQYQIAPNIKDVIFVDYEDVKNNPDYTINEGSFTDDLITERLKMNSFISYAIFSKSMSDEINFTPAATNLNNENSKLLKTENNFYYTSNDASITYNPDPSKKVICFKDRALKHSSDVNKIDEAIIKAKNEKSDSQSAFVYNYIRSQMLYNSTNIIPNKIEQLLTNEEMTEFNNNSYIIVPNKLLSTFNYSIDNFNNPYYNDLFARSEDASEKIQILKTYEGEIDDKIYLSKGGYNFIKLASVYNMPIQLSYSVERSFSDKATVYNEFISQIAPSNTFTEVSWAVNEGVVYNLSQLNTAFLSKDVGQTKRFFDEYKFMDEDLQGYIIEDVFQSYFKEVGIVNSRDVLVTLGLSSLSYLILLFSNAYSKANSEKYYYGVLRNIGKTRKEVNLENFYSFLFEYVLFVLLPIFVLTIYLALFNLFFMGFYFFISLLALFVINFLFELTPSFFMLQRTPNGIIRSLN